MVIRIERRVPSDTLRELEGRGHVLEVLTPWGGGGAVQLIERDASSGTLRGASDPRSGGVALGL
jgi:gamma-glutamyltranspeptidase